MEIVPLRQLDLEGLEALAIESQSMIDRALAGARPKLGTGRIIDAATASGPTIAVDAEPLDARGRSQTNKPRP